MSHSFLGYCSENQTKFIFTWKLELVPPGWVSVRPVATRLGLIMSDCHCATLIGTERLEAPFWHPLNLLSRLSVQTAPLYDRYPSFTDGKFFPALLPLTRQAEGQNMCAYVGVWVGADREGIHLPLLCPPRPIHLSFLHLFSVIYPPPPVSILAEGGLSL